MDDYLHWDPDDFGGVREVHLDQKYLWIPDVMLYNTYEAQLRSVFVCDVLCIFFSDMQGRPAKSETQFSRSDPSEWQRAVDSARNIPQLVFHRRLQLPFRRTSLLPLLRLLVLFVRTVSIFYKSRPSWDVLPSYLSYHAMHGHVLHVARVTATMVDGKNTEK